MCVGRRIAGAHGGCDGTGCGETVDFDTHEGERRPACDGPRNAADGDQRCRGVHGADEGGPDHDAGEDEVTEEPCGLEIGLVSCHLDEDLFEPGNRGGREGGFVVAWRAHSEGENDAAEEGDA